MTTIIESGSTYTEEFVAFRAEHMECSDPSGDADQSTQFHDGTSHYVTFEACQQGCLHDDSCNGMIEYGTDICDTVIDPLSQRPVCSGKSRKRVLLRCHLYIEMIILPRQARDKHRESTQKRTRFCRRPRALRRRKPLHLLPRDGHLRGANSTPQLHDLADAPHPR